MEQRNPQVRTSIIRAMILIFGMLFVLGFLLSLTGCATWYISDEEQAEMDALRRASESHQGLARRDAPVRACERVGEFGDLFCKDIPPEPECVKLGDYIYDCTELSKAEAKLNI